MKLFDRHNNICVITMLHDDKSKRKFNTKSVHFLLFILIYFIIYFFESEQTIRVITIVSLTFVVDIEV